MAQPSTLPGNANAILSSDHMLVTLGRSGSVQQLWWPRVDRDPQLDMLRLGTVSPDGSVSWLDTFAAEQHYEPAASVLHTVLASDTGDIHITDLIPVATPLLRRHVKGPVGRLVIHVRPTIGGAPRSGGAYLDGDIVVFHRGPQAMAVGTSATSAAGVRRAEELSDADFVRAWHGRTAFGRVEGMIFCDDAPAGATIAVGMAGDRDTAVALVCEALETDRASVVEERRLDDASRLTPPPKCLDERVRSLDLRSQLVLEMLTDKPSGGVIAAPECDPDFAISGGYGYVWPRDLAFITLGLLAAERLDLVRPALTWLANAQSPDGLWLQRHWTDRTLAPSWGTQLDETGCALFAYEQAYRHTRDETLDRQLWPSAAKAADALARTLDPRTGLPAASRDLWEERLGIHTFTSAAVCAGLRAAAAMAKRHDPDRGQGWQDESDRLLGAIDEYLWSSGTGCYRRAINVARDDRQGHPTPTHYTLAGHPEQMARSVDLQDDTIDVSVLGLLYPFRLKTLDDHRMASTLSVVEHRLRTPDGGLMRYEGDSYAGGNPWVLARLWLGLSRRPVASSGPADGIDYAVASATPTELLPEQVDARTGEPAWVVPLAWSHAMLLLASRPDGIVAPEPAISASAAG